MSEAHTPGPWSVGYGVVKARAAYVFGVGIPTTPDWAPIAILSPADLVNDKDVANAALIAAAPELYEALKEVVRISGRKHGAWDKAHAALARAGGKAA